jgi:riboflavin synthase alpha subunit
MQAYQRFSVALIPHTRDVTNANSWQEGTHVNLKWTLSQNTLSV